MRHLLGLLFVCAVQAADVVGSDLLDGRFAAGLRAAAGQDLGHIIYYCVYYYAYVMYYYILLYII